ncbi:MAG TPA: outer membrane lipoprotein carrier protein LolA [bacterium]|nr:outer membrane lipoprotein carrier protein LolA [bacterium]
MRRIALLAFLLTFTAALAGELTTEEVVARVKASYATADSFTCDVRRVTASGMLGQRHVMRGSMTSLLPDEFRIDYVSPFEQSLVCNGETVWLYTPRNNQVIVSSVEDYAEREMLGNLIGYFERDYAYALAGEEEVDGRNTVVLRMTALSPDYPYPRGRLWVDPETWLPAEVELTDDIGNTVSYRLSNIRLNVAVDRSSFNFTPPPGVEVVRVD